MNVRLTKHSCGFRIVSLAKDEMTRDDLLADNIDFIYLSSAEISIFPENILLSTDILVAEKLGICNNYDVFELWPDGYLRQCYNDSSSDNYFFVTGKCNSNCIMCPSPDEARRNSEQADVDRLIEIAKHIPSDVRHLTITGGEPFMAGERIFEFFKYLQEKFVNTEFLILTNGRIFAVKKYTELLQQTMPTNTILGIPLHGSNSLSHDTITRSENSFIQTLSGIKRLLALGIKVELRLVVCNLNVCDYFEMAKLIVSEIPNVCYISIMAAEMTGNAYINRENVWIPYKESFSKISKVLMYLLEHEIDVKLYNYPLCTVDKEYWALCEKSISPSKIKYGEECNQCKYRDACGGVFAGTFLLERNELKAIV